MPNSLGKDTRRKDKKQTTYIIIKNDIIINVTWFAFSLISVLALATAELMQQYLLAKHKQFDEITSTVLTSLVQSMITIPVIIFSPFKSDFWNVFSVNNLPFFILLALVSSAGTISYIKGLQVKNISISGIFFSLSVIISTTLGIIVFKESFYFYKILGILLILGAILSLGIKNLQLEKNHLYALIGGLLFGVVYTIDKQIVQTVHPMVYVFWSFIAVSVTVFAFKSQEVVESVKSSKLADYKPIVASGVAYFLYNFATFMAYSKGGEVGRVDAVNNSQVFIIILVEYFIMRHTEDIFRKILAASAAFAGVAILGIL